MRQKTLTPAQLGKLSGIESPVLRQRFALYYQLPQDVQGLIFAEESVEKIRLVVVDKNNLKDEDRKYVAWIIGLILLGEIPIKNLIKELSKKLNLDGKKASALAQDINQTIFQPVRKSLMEVHGIRDEPPKSHTPGQAGIKNTSPSLGTNQESSTKNREVTPSRTVNNPKPVSIKELEEMNRGEVSPSQSMAPAEPENETEERRERLLKKLEQDKGGRKTIDLSEKTLLKKRSTKQPPQENPKAITTAWNGRTIDLTKIPPRRKSTRKKHKRIKIHEA